MVTFDILISFSVLIISLATFVLLCANVCKNNKESNRHPLRLRLLLLSWSPSTDSTLFIIKLYIVTLTVVKLLYTKGIERSLAELFLYVGM